MRDGAGMAGVDERLVMDFSTGRRISKNTGCVLHPNDTSLSKSGMGLRTNCRRDFDPGAVNV